MTCMMTKIQFGQRIQSHQNPKHVTNRSSCILPNTHSCSFVKLHLYLFVLTLKIVKANADNHFDVKYMMPLNISKLAFPLSLRFQENYVESKCSSIQII